VFTSEQQAWYKRKAKIVEKPILHYGWSKPRLCRTNNERKVKLNTAWTLLSSINESIENGIKMILDQKPNSAFS